MRVIFILMIFIGSIHLDGSCKGCVARRLEMLAKRKSLKEIFHTFHTQIDQLSKVPDHYHAGRYTDQLALLEQVINYERNNFKIKILLDKRKSHTDRSIRYVYARSVLDTFMYLPQPLEEFRVQRNHILAEILAADPDHYTSPMLQHVTTTDVNSHVFTTLCQMCENGHPIDQKFALYLHFYNNQVMHEQDIDPVAVACNALAIDLERLSQLHLENLEALVSKLAQLMQWESLLQKIAKSSYKIEDSTELAIARAQQEYMKSRREYILKHRELSVYR